MPYNRDGLVFYSRSLERISGKSIPRFYYSYTAELVFKIARVLLSSVVKNRRGIVKLFHALLGETFERKANFCE